MKKNSILVVVSLVLVLLGGLLAYFIQTDCGNVDVKEVRINGKDGAVISALLYVPQNATNETPAPAVLTMHGFMNSRETQSAFNIELARRGYVVMALDMLGHGYSEQTDAWPEYLGNIPIYSYGASESLRYLAGLPFVDEGQIALEGHSMGGWAMINASLMNPGAVNTMILAGSGPLAPGLVMADYGYNLCVIFAKYDEFAGLMWGVSKASDLVGTDNLKMAFGTTENIEPGKLYGSFENRTARTLYIPEETHPKNHLSAESTGYIVSFIQNAMPAPNELDPANQRWQFKELGTLLILLGVILFIFAFASKLFDAPYFKATMQKPAPSAGIKGWGWWVGAVVATAIPALTFFKILEPYDNQWWLGSFWPQLLTNSLAFWVMLNAAIALVLFLLWHFIAGRKQGGAVAGYGLSTSSESAAFSIRQIGRTLLMAVVIVGAAHILLSIVQSVFIADARWWVLALKPMDVSRFAIFLNYLPPFFLFFLVNGIILHGQLRPKESETEGKTTARWMLSAILVNALGVTVMVLIHLVHLLTTETLLWGSMNLFMILAYQVIFILVLVSCISTYFFKKTGSIYAGALINTLLVTWYIVAGQAILFPV